MVEGNEQTVWPEKPGFLSPEKWKRNKKVVETLSGLAVAVTWFSGEEGGISYSYMPHKYDIGGKKPVIYLSHMDFFIVKDPTQEPELRYNLLDPEKFSKDTVKRVIISYLEIARKWEPPNDLFRRIGTQRKW